jgi:hypothetical protein
LPWEETSRQQAAIRQIDASIAPFRGVLKVDMGTPKFTVGFIVCYVANMTKLKRWISKGAGDPRASIFGGG